MIPYLLRLQLNPAVGHNRRVCGTCGWDRRIHFLNPLLLLRDVLSQMTFTRRAPFFLTRAFISFACRREKRYRIGNISRRRRGTNVAAEKSREKSETVGRVKAAAESRWKRWPERTALRGIVHQSIGRQFSFSRRTASPPRLATRSATSTFTRE